MSRTQTRRIASAAAALALTGGAVAATAPAASAAPIESCPDGRICFFFNSNWDGARADYVYSDAGLGNELFSDRGGSGYNVQVNNNAASIVNNRNYPVYVFDGADCTLPGYLVPANSKRNLANVGPGLKNKVSSFVVGDGSACISRDQSRY